MFSGAMANAVTRYFPPQPFGATFRVLGQTPRFRHPFKYARSFNVNRLTVHSARGYDLRARPFIPSSQ
jgi:hypothetical protein